MTRKYTLCKRHWFRMPPNPKDRGSECKFSPMQAYKNLSWRNDEFKNTVHDILGLTANRADSGCFPAESPDVVYNTRAFCYIVSWVWHNTADPCLKESAWTFNFSPAVKRIANHSFSGPHTCKGSSEQVTACPTLLPPVAFHTTAAY